MNKRDLKADLELCMRLKELCESQRSRAQARKLDTIKLPETLDIATHAIERAIKAEALARELVDVLEIACEGMYVNIPNIRMARATLAKAKEVLGSDH